MPIKDFEWRLRLKMIANDESSRESDGVDGAEDKKYFLFILYLFPTIRQFPDSACCAPLLLSQEHSLHSHSSSCQSNSNSSLCSSVGLFSLFYINTSSFPGESAVGKSRYNSTCPHPSETSSSPTLVLCCASSRTNLTTTEKVPLEVSINDKTHLLSPIYPHIAAFLTQTVTLDDQTTVKFEIW